MKPHLERRNKEMREEYRLRLERGAKRFAIIADLASKYDLSIDTVLYIIGGQKYGTHRKRTSAMQI